MEFFIDQFIGFRDSHYLVNAFADFNVGVQKLGLVADHAYDGNLGALDRWAVSPLDSMRFVTFLTASSEALGFIMIIIIQYSLCKFINMQIVWTIVYILQNDSYAVIV